MQPSLLSKNLHLLVQKTLEGRRGIRFPLRYSDVGVVVVAAVAIVVVVGDIVGKIIATMEAVAGVDPVNTVVVNNVVVNTVVVNNIVVITAVNTVKIVVDHVVKPKTAIV